uniref:Uncharacterized protein n=1 Tax=Arundo donax TaxID=35708 RepID=A0A0A9EGX6_ARUDO
MTAIMSAGPQNQTIATRTRTAARPSTNGSAAAAASWSHRQNASSCRTDRWATPARAAEIPAKKPVTSCHRPPGTSKLMSPEMPSAMAPSCRSFLAAVSTMAMLDVAPLSSDDKKLPAPSRAKPRAAPPSVTACAMAAEPPRSSFLAAVLGKAMASIAERGLCVAVWAVA